MDLKQRQQDVRKGDFYGKGMCPAKPVNTPKHPIANPSNQEKIPSK